MGFTVAEIQATPNPNAIKFVLDRAVTPQPLSFLTPESAKAHPLASRLFGVPGVCSVLLLGDFITVNKAPEASWADIRTAVRRALAEA